MSAPPIQQLSSPSPSPSPSPSTSSSPSSSKQPSSTVVRHLVSKKVLNSKSKVSSVKPPSQSVSGSSKSSSIHPTSISTNTSSGGDSSRSGFPPTSATKSTNEKRNKPTSKSVQLPTAKGGSGESSNVIKDAEEMISKEVSHMAVTSGDYIRKLIEQLIVSCKADSGFSLSIGLAIGSVVLLNVFKQKIIN